MRIIAGEFRGRHIKSPQDYSIRPTSDKVKEAVFSIIVPFIQEDSVAMDVFSGSGNLGLEAISRGVSKVYFSDNSRDSLRLIRENISLCGADDRSVILTGDFRANISRVSEKIDFFFLDPPYADGFILPAVDAIMDKGSLSEEGMIICEHDSHDILPEEYRGLEAVKMRRYGKTRITVYKRKEL